MSEPSKKLLDQVRDALSAKHYSYCNKPGFLVSSHAQLRQDICWRGGDVFPNEGKTILRERKPAA